MNKWDQANGGLPNSKYDWQRQEILLAKIWNETHAELSVIAHENQTRGFLFNACVARVLLCYSTWPRPGLFLTVGEVLWRYVVTGSFLGGVTKGHVRAMTVAVLPLPGLVTLGMVYLYSVCHCLEIHTQTHTQSGPVTSTQPLSKLFKFWHFHQILFNMLFNVKQAYCVQYTNECRY